MIPHDPGRPHILGKGDKMEVGALLYTCLQGKLRDQGGRAPESARFGYVINLNAHNVHGTTKEVDPKNLSVWVVPLIRMHTG